MKYKVGDRVRIKRDLKNLKIPDELKKYKGTTDKIVGTVFDIGYMLENNFYFWDEEWLEAVEENKKEDNTLLQQLIEEYEKIDNKKSEFFEVIPNKYGIERHLLEKQLDAVCDYERYLEYRIELCRMKENNKEK